MSHEKMKNKPSPLRDILERHKRQRKERLRNKTKENDNNPSPNKKDKEAPTKNTVKRKRPFGRVEVEDPDVIRKGELGYDDIEATSLDKEDKYAMLQQTIGNLQRAIKRHLSHGPKSEKHAIRKDILEAVVTIMRYAVEAHKAENKKTPLNRLDTEHEVLRNFWRNYHQSGYLEYPYRKNPPSRTRVAKRIAEVDNLIDRLGRQIGGWIRYNNERIQESKKKKK